MFLTDAYVLDILVHLIVLMECFDDSLKILQNFEKAISMQKS